MKTKTETMKNLLLTLVASLFILPSCIDKHEVDFAITGSSFIIQEEGTDGKMVFNPYLMVFSQSMVHELKKVTVQNSSSSIDMTKVSVYEWVSQCQYSNLKDLNGTYQIIATNQDDKTVQEVITYKLDEKDIIGEIKVDTFYYDKKTITAKVKVPENAKALGFSVTRFNKPEEERPYNSSFYPVVYEYKKTTGEIVSLDDIAKDGYITIQLQFDTNSSDFMMYFNLARVGVWACSDNAVYRIDKDTKMLSNGAQSF